jgi:hypothetical protein
MPHDLRVELVKASYGTVGTLQRLAEAACRSEDVLRTERKRRSLSADCWEAATRQVAASMRPRFDRFAQSFVQGVAFGPQTRETYRHLLCALLSSFSDDDLLQGVPAKELAQAIEHDAPGAVTAKALSEALKRLIGLQHRASVRPVVLTYAQDTRVVSVADRSLLFFRKYGNPTWPWDDNEGVLF